MKRGLSQSLLSAILSGMVALFCLQTCSDAGRPVTPVTPGDDVPSDSVKPPCPGVLPAIAPVPAYDSPVWHPNGQLIGFNHTPLTRIEYPYRDTCIGWQKWNDSLAGFWLINPDGTDMRRVLPFQLIAPAWSPDGQWIAFGLGAQIFKMRFTGYSFDTSTIVQLTTEGLNFLPTWNSDGTYIAYRRGYSYPEPFAIQGIWKMTMDGNTSTQIYSGNSGEPSWHPFRESIICLVGVVPSPEQGAGNLLWEYHLGDNSLVRKFLLPGFNRHPLFAPEGGAIAFWSNPEKIVDPTIWLIDTSGTNRRRLTELGADPYFSWNPKSPEIVFMRYQPGDWTIRNGVLWVVNSQTGEERQLTFNP